VAESRHTFLTSRIERNAMTHLLFAAAVLSASLAAEPAKKADTKEPAAKQPAAEKAVKAAPRAAPAKREEPKPLTEAEKAAAAAKQEAAEQAKREAALAVEEALADAPAGKTAAQPGALDDARQALLGPCSPEMATGKVKAIRVIDGGTLNTIRAKQKSKLPKEHPAAVFLSVQVEAPQGVSRDFRQINPQFRLTTEQAQALVGDKVCVFGTP